MPFRFWSFGWDSFWFVWMIIFCLGFDGFWLCVGQQRMVHKTWDDGKEQNCCQDYKPLLTNSKSVIIKDPHGAKKTKWLWYRNVFQWMCWRLDVQHCDRTSSADCSTSPNWFHDSWCRDAVKMSSSQLWKQSDQALHAYSIHSYLQSFARRAVIIVILVLSLALLSMEIWEIHIPTKFTDLENNAKKRLKSCHSYPIKQQKIIS